MAESLIEAFPELDKLNYTMKEILESEQVGISVAAGIREALAKPGLRGDTRKILEEQLEGALLTMDIGRLRRAMDAGMSEMTLEAGTPLADMLTTVISQDQSKLRTGMMLMDDAEWRDFITNILNGKINLDVYGESLLNATADLAVFKEEAGLTGEGLGGLADDVANLTEEIYSFSGAREELFFGGKYGNVTGSMYRQVVQQGVGTLYHKNEVIMSNNFHGFFNEEEAATRIMDILDEDFAERR